MRNSARSWPYAGNSVGRFRGVLNFGLLVGQLRCWEAIGPARCEFAEELSQQIVRCLEDSSTSLPQSGLHLDLSLFMVGKVPERARPTVMLVSGDKKARKEAVKLVKESGIMDDYPGFALADMPLDAEYKNFRALCGRLGREEAVGAAAAQVPSLSIFPATKYWYGGGRKLYAFADTNMGESQASHTSTAGGVVSHQRRSMLFTAYHVGAGSQLPTDPLPTNLFESQVEDEIDDDEDDECEISGFSDDDDDGGDEDEREESPESFPGGLMTPETPDSADFLMMESHSPGVSYHQIIDAVGDGLPVAQLPIVDTAWHHPKPPIPNLRPPLEIIPTGQVAISAPELDVLLIDAGFGLEFRLGRGLEEFARNRIALEDYHQHIEPRARDADVTTSTCSTGASATRGSISGTPSFVRLPFAKTFQQVYSATFSKPLLAGASGSWVKDAATGRLFGHVIAGSPTTGLAMVMPANRVFPRLLRELEEKRAGASGQKARDAPLAGSWASSCLPELSGGHSMGTEERRLMRDDGAWIGFPRSLLPSRQDPTTMSMERAHTV